MEIQKAVGSEYGRRFFEIWSVEDFKRKVNMVITEALREPTGHFVACINCDGLGEIMTEHDCRGMGYPMGGCPGCNGLGYTAKECPVCHGDKEIVVTEDEGLEIYKEVSR